MSKSGWIAICVGAGIAGGFVGAHFGGADRAGAQEKPLTSDWALTSCNKCVGWQFKSVQIPSGGTDVEILPPGTHGVLHRIIGQPSYNTISVWEGSFPSGAYIADPFSIVNQELNIQFTNGLTLHGSQSSIITFTYRLD